jgi:hypothetical protein
VGYLALPVTIWLLKLRSDLRSFPLALIGQRPPFNHTNLTDASTQPKCLLVCLVLTHTTWRKPPGRCVADAPSWTGNPSVGVGVACRRHSLPVGISASLVTRLCAVEICDLSIHLRRDSHLARIHKVGDSGGLLPNFSLPPRRSPYQVERGASTGSANASWRSPNCHAVWRLPADISLRAQQSIWHLIQNALEYCCVVESSCDYQSALNQRDRFFSSLTGGCGC